jgi:hypothetical protein
MGSGVTFVPPVGWELTDGARTDDEPRSGLGAGDVTAALGNGGVVVQVRRGAFDGSADELLDQLNRLRSTSDAEPNRAFKVTGPRRTVTTATGITGVEESYTSAGGEGRILAFTLDAGEDGSTPTGVMVEIDGNHDAYAAQATEIADLIDTLQYEEPAP